MGMIVGCQKQPEQVKESLDSDVKIQFEEADQQIT